MIALSNKSFGGMKYSSPKTRTEHLVKFLEFHQVPPRWKIGPFEQSLSAIHFFPDAYPSLFPVCCHEQLLPCALITMAFCWTTDPESTAKESGLNSLKLGTRTDNSPFELFCFGIWLQ